MAAVFLDREDAGRQLAARLKDLSSFALDGKQLIVLGIPRGGMVVASEVARSLQAVLDVFLSRKLGVPGQEELAFGAVCLGAEPLLDPDVIRATGVSNAEIERITAAAREELERRASLYRDNRPAAEVAGRIVILVDDGIATGASMLAAVKALRVLPPEKLIAAVPVAPLDTCNWLKSQVDELVCLFAPRDFYAVGQFYRQFGQVKDEEVTRLLRMAEAGSVDAA